MKQYKDKKDGHAVSAMTFDEFIEYGKANGGNINNGMPWSFKIGDRGVTHENDERYLVETPHLHGNYPYSDFTPKDILHIGVLGELTPMPAEEFYKHYEPA